MTKLQVLPSIAFSLVFSGAAQQPEESSRQLWNTEFLDKRPPAPASQKQAAPVRYRQSSHSVTMSTGPAEMVGITFWRMRAPSGKSGERLLVLEPDPNQPTRELEPERINADTPLAEGDKVRISIEAPTFGYLYVIDREIYADSGLGDPYLIYPNRQTRPGDNITAPGRMLEIPEQEARPNCFTIRAQRPGLAGELLSVVISPSAFQDLQIGGDPLKLEKARVVEWERQWGEGVQQLDLIGGLGEGWTEREKQAGANHKTRLTTSDAPPQNLYRINAKPGSPFLVNIPLKLRLK